MYFRYIEALPMDTIDPGKQYDQLFRHVTYAEGLFKEVFVRGFKGRDAERITT